MDKNTDKSYIAETPDEDPRQDEMNEDERNTAISITVLYECFCVLLGRGADPVDAFETAVWDIFTDDVGKHLEQADPEYAAGVMDGTKIMYECVNDHCSARFSDLEAAKMHDQDNEHHHVSWIKAERPVDPFDPEVRYGGEDPNELWGTDR